LDTSPGRRQRQRAIDRVETREALELRRRPYWKRLATGRYVGYRRMSKARPGTWLARYHDGEDYKFRALGEFADLEARLRYDAAKTAAEEWFRHLDHGGSTGRESVKDACTAYAAKLRLEKGEAAAKDAEGSFRRLVVSDPIANVELAKLKPAQVSAWRERIFERGSRTYFNRNLTALRAALNLAFDERKVASDSAWSKALRPLKLDPAEGRRTIYLDAAQRRKLIEKASKEFRPLLVAWTLLPVRPGDIAKLRVQDLDLRHRLLRIPSGKASAREVPLPEDTLEHFKACAKDKLPGAWLIAKADGGQWDRFYWRDAMWDAVRKAKLPRATVAYTIRHSVITDLLTGNDPLDIFTVAKLSGTSVAMIDRFYGKLRQEHARKALAKLAL
jgi:integrase